MSPPMPAGSGQAGHGRAPAAHLAGSGLRSRSTTWPRWGFRRTGLSDLEAARLVRTLSGSGRHRGWGTLLGGRSRPAAAPGRVRRPAVSWPPVEPRGAPSSGSSTRGAAGPRHSDRRARGAAARAMRAPAAKHRTRHARREPAGLAWRRASAWRRRCRRRAPARRTQVRQQPLEQETRHGVQRLVDAATARRRRLEARNTARVQRLLELLDTVELRQVALVVLQDERDALERQPLLAQVLVEVAQRFEVVLHLPEAGIGHEHHRIGALEHELAGSVVEHWNGVEQGECGNRPRSSRAGSRRTACGPAVSSSTPSCRASPRGRWRRCIRGWSSFRTAQDRSRRSWR
jgi:hypothetical protein